IDVKIKRFGSSSSSTFPKGDIRYYITSTHSNGYPNLGDKKTRARIINNNEVDRNGSSVSENFDNIDVVKLYFDPDELGVLSTSQKYAVVIEYWYTNYDNWTDSYYKIAATESGSEGPYSGGYAIRIERDYSMVKYPKQDLWFKIYKPDPTKPDNLHKKWLEYQAHNSALLAQDLKNKLNGTNLKLYAYSGYEDLYIYPDYESPFQRYSVQWGKLKNIVDVVICGYGANLNITPTINAIGANKTFIGGGQNQSDCNWVLSQNGFDGMFYYYAGPFSNDNWQYPMAKSSSLSYIENKKELMVYNFPNPFNPTTKIKYSIKEDSNVKIVVYNILGQQVQTLVDEEKLAGNYQVTFNAKRLPSGLYYCKITTNKENKTIKMILTK
ncbi:MAG: T9SS type A sorting domain-containing protein, partial [Rhodothermaceae bacterium]